MKKLALSVLLANGLMVAASAFGNQQICPLVPPQQWMSKQQVEALALGLGYEKVFFVQPDGGCWVAYTEKQGVRVELFFHPATGEVVRTERGS
jgi:hypothetical protein